jgi:anti-sigma factor RsiW
MKVIAADVAAHLGMCRKAATESHATAGEMASAKAAAHASAAAEPPAHMSTAEPAAHMTATAEPAPVSTSTSPAAARKRVGGQPRGESGSRQQHNHDLT